MSFMLNRAIGNRAPVGPFKLNRDSEQARGLIGWWPGAHPGGSTLYDLSGRGLHGTLTNMDPASDWVASPFGGRALDLDGSNDRIMISGSPSVFDGLTDVTLAIWGAPLSDDTSRAGVFGNRTEGSTGGGYLHILRNIDTVGFQVSEGTVYAESLYTQSWPIGETALVVARRRGTNVQLYYNGRPGATATTGSAAFTSTTPLVIGAYHSYAAANSTSSRFWDARVYSRALSDAEIWSLYDPATRWDLYWQPSGRLIYYPTSGSGSTDSLTDTLSTSDTFASGIVAGASLSETLSPTDTFAATVVSAGGTIYEESLSDSLGLTDALASGAIYTAALTDALTLAETFAAGLIATNALSDSLTLTDLAGGAVPQTYTDSLADALVLADSYMDLGTLAEIIPNTDLAGLWAMDSALAGSWTTNTDLRGIVRQ